MKRTIILGSIGIAITLSTTGCEKDHSQVRAAAVEPIPNIRIFQVSRSSVAETYEATGTVTAKTTTQISARSLGRINTITVSEGDTVKKGQLLVQIDSRDAVAQLEKAQAGLREAQASLIELDNSTIAASAAVRTAEANKQFVDVSFGRYKELYKRKAVSGQEYDEALSRSDAARSELDRAKANVQTTISRKGQILARIEQAKADIANSKVNASYARIASPVSGVIVKKLAEVGAMASPGVPLLSIEDNSQYRLEAAVGESQLVHVHIGDRVNVRIDAIGSGEIVGTVGEILPTSDTSSRSYTVKIVLPANPLLRSGMFGAARFQLSQKEAIAIPQVALTRRGQLTGVYVIGRDGIAQFRIVTTGKTTQGMVEVLSGLSEGDEVASTEMGTLKDGIKVR